MAKEVKIVKIITPADKNRQITVISSKNAVFLEKAIFPGYARNSRDLSYAGLEE